MQVSVADLLYIAHYYVPFVFAGRRISNSYNTDKSALPDIYARRRRARSARGRVRIYQAKHECLCYK